jgi:EAL domain-containing protein (putative c-di-GMP-specific phosphodiesterase class I)
LRFFSFSILTHDQFGQGPEAWAGKLTIQGASPGSRRSVAVALAISALALMLAGTPLAAAHEQALIGEATTARAHNGGRTETLLDSTGGSAWDASRNIDYSCREGGIVVVVGILLCALGAILRSKAGCAQFRDIRRGIRAEEFVPHYQPVVDAATITWSGVEVLARWLHPKKGLLPAGAFIESAETSGLIVPLTQKLMKSVAKDLAHWKRTSPMPLSVSINITSAHCMHEGFVEDCRNFIASFETGEVQLIIELTERQAFANSVTVKRRFERLRELGIKFAIDDFGTGYSNLNYLNDYEIDIIKIDRQFITGLPNGLAEKRIVENIIDLSNRFGLYIIAEGVEDEKTADCVQALGIRYIQGFWFGPPMPLSSLLRILGEPVRGAKL